jgi:hypothetical protein
MWVQAERTRHGLSDNLEIRTVPLADVNAFLNRSRLSLFTSDEEGMCRAVIQTLLAERPILCYRGSKAITRIIYDNRYFNFYSDQTERSVGEAADYVLTHCPPHNTGARDYILAEKGMKFFDLAGWRDEVLSAAAALYARDGQQIETRDIVPLEELHLWQPFEMRV